MNDMPKNTLINNYWFLISRIILSYYNNNISNGNYKINYSDKKT